MCSFIMISTSTSLKIKQKYKKSNAMQISKLWMVQIKTLTFKICGRLKGFCNWMDVVKVMKGFKAIVNGWILKMMFNLKLPNNSINKLKVNHKLVDFLYCSHVIIMR
jgi:hypothetical protein